MEVAEETVIVVVVADEDLFFEVTGFLEADLIDSNSLIIRELIVPVAPTLMDPPPPLMGCNF